MPLYRRMPKRGFKNPFHREFAIVNVSDLARCFPKGGDVGPEALVGAGLLAARRAASSRCWPTGSSQPWPRPWRRSRSRSTGRERR